MTTGGHRKSDRNRRHRCQRRNLFERASERQSRHVSILKSFIDISRVLHFQDQIQTLPDRRGRTTTRVFAAMRFFTPPCALNKPYISRDTPVRYVPLLAKTLMHHYVLFRKTAAVNSRVILDLPLYTNRHSKSLERIAIGAII